jgi:hypothetical protein
MASSAFVARVQSDHLEYLAAARVGRPQWVAVPAEAATFETVREATRQAMRLPGRMRAFAYPKV